MEGLKNTDDTLEIAVSGVAKKLPYQGRLILWFGKKQTTFFPTHLFSLKTCKSLLVRANGIWSQWGLLKCSNYPNIYAGNFKLKADIIN